MSCASEDLTKLIPHDKLLKSMENLTPQEGKTSVIAISTGSLCPVHLMHLEMMETALRHLEAMDKYNVLGGFLSPSQDIYVGTKLRDKAIKGSDRVNMAELICADSPKISVSSWEATRPGAFVDYPQVVRYHKHYFNEILPQTLEELKPFLPIRVTYVCGSDHALRCSLFSVKPGGVVIVARPGIRPNDRTLLMQHYQVTEKELADVSSTIIRQRIANKEPLEDLCGPKVSAFLYKLYNYDQ